MLFTALARCTATRDAKHFGFHLNQEPRELDMFQGASGSKSEWKQPLNEEDPLFNTKNNSFSRHQMYIFIIYHIYIIISLSSIS